MATKNSSNINVTKDQELNSKNHVLKNSQVRIFQKTAYMWAACQGAEILSYQLYLYCNINTIEKLNSNCHKNVINGNFFNKKLLKKANVKNSPCLLIDQAF